MEEHCNDKERYPVGVKCEATRWEPMTLQMGGMFHMSFCRHLGSSRMEKERRNGNRT